MLLLLTGIIDKTAVAICKSPAPTLLEEKIRDHQKKDPKFSFLTDGDAYNRYYRYMIERIREVGEETALSGGSSTAAGGTGLTPNGASAGGATPGGGSGSGGSMDVADQRRNVERMKQKMEEESLEEPKPLEFADDLPNVTAYDLDVLRLTALFTAKRGRSFLQSLSVREGRNFQFDFLRPSHSLFGYFNRTVEMYIKIMAPPAELLEELDLGEGDERKWDVLDRARKRGEWERIKREREQQRKEEKEREAKAFAEIDWQDFAVVQTIEFTSADADPSAIELPPPTSVRAMQMLTLTEKRMAAMIDEEGQQHRREGDADDQEMDVEMEDQEEQESEEVLERKRREAAELERARAVQAKALGKAGMKIKTDYTPGARTGRVAAGAGAKVPTTVCPYCKQNIPETEITEHIRIELLDPKWKEQKQLMDQKKSQAAQLMQGTFGPHHTRRLQRADVYFFPTFDSQAPMSPLPCDNSQAHVQTCLATLRTKKRAKSRKPRSVLLAKPKRRSYGTVTRRRKSRPWSNINSDKISTLRSRPSIKERASATTLLRRSARNSVPPQRASQHKQQAQLLLRSVVPVFPRDHQRRHLLTHYRRCQCLLQCNTAMDPPCRPQLVVRRHQACIHLDWRKWALVGLHTRRQRRLKQPVRHDL